MTDKKCGFDGCGRKYDAKGLCKTHYNQQARGVGLTPIASRMGRPAGSNFANIEEFFWARVEKSSDCWNWTGAKTTLGYGLIKYGGSVTAAHRFSYELLVGEIREAGVIDHLCHNSSCVNPQHLRVASHTQNMQNRRGAHSNSKSGVRGVWWSTANKKWRVFVASGGKKHHGGYFADIKDAEVAAQELRRLLHS